MSNPHDKKESSAIDHARLGFARTPNLSDEANWEHIGSEVLGDASVRSHIPAPIP